MEATKIKQFLQTVNPTKQTHRDAVMRALLFMLGRQTADEQATATTHVHNSIGFNGVDAAFLTDVGQWAKTKGFISPKQTAAVAKRLVKYTGQLTEYQK